MHISSLRIQQYLVLQSDRFTELAHKMFSVAIVACLVSVAVGMTTQHGHHGHHTHPANHGHHGTHPTHEPNINENFMFHYDAHSHTMAVKTSKQCCLYMLSADEQTSVHSSTGLHAIEKNIIDLIDANTVTTAMDLTAMSHGLSHFCGKLTAMRLN
ncbi:uncharacterized protein LOC125680795 [Ostrea edulis]|uniref:uncharacterized protein LOC125680795 n=1 Tax=Ostrea edulis TaxID=37623 RepID=UPI0024AF4001|nr:uncharacterized protein LOC125680795 [Ostrea edulis]